MEIRQHEQGASGHGGVKGGCFAHAYGGKRCLGFRFFYRTQRHNHRSRPVAGRGARHRLSSFFRAKNYRPDTLVGRPKSATLPGSEHPHHTARHLFEPSSASTPPESSGAASTRSAGSRHTRTAPAQSPAASPLPRGRKASAATLVPTRLAPVQLVHGMHRLATAAEGIRGGAQEARAHRVARAQACTIRHHEALCRGLAVPGEVVEANCAAAAADGEDQRLRGRPRDGEHVRSCRLEHQRLPPTRAWRSRATERLGRRGCRRRARGGEGGVSGPARRAPCSGREPCRLRRTRRRGCARGARPTHRARAPRAAETSA